MDTAYRSVLEEKEFFTILFLYYSVFLLFVVNISIYFEKSGTPKEIVCFEFEMEKKI